MRYFNADGSEAEFCGNGASCLALFAYSKRIVSDKMNFVAKSGVIQAEVKNGKVKLRLPNPQDLRLNFSLKVNGKNYTFFFVNTGVPHTVHFSRDVDKIDVKGLGQKVRFHKFFQPQGTNVDFVKVRDKKTILIRTYERGVEEETLSCGTGVVASAVIAGIKNLVQAPVQVITRGGEIFKVYYRCNRGAVKEVYLENSPKFVFEGKIAI